MGFQFKDRLGKIHHIQKFVCRVEALKEAVALRGPMFGAVLLGLLIVSATMASVWMLRNPVCLRQEVLPEIRSEKLYTKRIGEGVRLRSARYPGISLVSFDSCRIEKLNKGGFSFGGLNVLVIEGLELNIPDTYGAPEQSTKAVVPQPEENIGRQVQPMQKVMASEEAVKRSMRLLEKDIAVLIGSKPNVSGLHLDGVAVYSVDVSNKRELLFEAAEVRSGFNRKLEVLQCRLRNREGRLISMATADLFLERPILIRGNGREFNLEQMLANVRGKRQGVTSVQSDHRDESVRIKR